MPVITAEEYKKRSQKAPAEKSVGVPLPETKKELEDDMKLRSFIFKPAVNQEISYVNILGEQTKLENGVLVVGNLEQASTQKLIETIKMMGFEYLKDFEGELFDEGKVQKNQDQNGFELVEGYTYDMKHPDGDGINADVKIKVAGEEKELKIVDSIIANVDFETAKVLAKKKYIVADRHEVSKE